MLDILHPNISNINKNNIDINLSEEKIKINIRGKNKEFFTKVGKILSIILPSESNTSSSNENYDVLWLSPDEWMIYFDENKNSIIFDQLYKDISSLNFGSITDISSQLICINIKGENIFELFPKKNDAQIADAILELFRKRETLEVFNKKALYIYIREMVDVKTPKITKIADKLHDIFKQQYIFYLENGYARF